MHPEKGGQRLAPVTGEWVTLHRVGTDTAGPMDSVRTDAQGRYTFTYRPWGARDAVYFVSATYDGIAYFSQPLAQPVVRGAESEITVYDTTAHAVPLRMRGRHLVVSAPTAAGYRSVIEVFELSNDSSVTLVPGGPRAERPSWSLALPAGTQRFQVGQGDVSAAAVTVDRGIAEVFAPIAPGLKQISFSYALPPTAFPLTRALPTGAIVLEVLVEEPSARVIAPRLHEVQPVSVEGRTFRRFLGQDVPAGATLRVTVPVTLGNRRALYFAVVAIVIGAAMLASLALAFRRRPTIPASLASHASRG